MKKYPIDEAEKYIKSMFHNSTDLKVRKFVSFGKINSIAFFFDTIVDTKRADKEVILQLMHAHLPQNLSQSNAQNTPTNEAGATTPTPASNSAGVTCAGTPNFTSDETDAGIPNLAAGVTSAGTQNQMGDFASVPFVDDSNSKEPPIKNSVAQNIQSPARETSEGADADAIVDYAIENAVIVGQAEAVEDEPELAQKLLNGFFAVYFENSTRVLLVDVKNFQSRAIEEPPTSAVLKGPREGFNESINTNIMLLRKRVKSQDLVVKQMPVGKYSQTQVAIVYVSSIASSEVVQKVENNIKKIDIDGIIDSYYVQKALEAREYSLFKQVGSSEKPDVVVAKILEGRVAIVVDGTPIVLTVPFLLLEDIQSSNDYYFTRSPRVAFLRYLRAFGVLVSIFLPGFYVALQVYHYKVVPLKFLVTIANSSQGIPFTPLMEVLFIIILFEGLTEASLRMPRYLGLALSIVGALILGETAVNAGLVSPPAVMIVALTGVLIYTVPDQQAQLSVLRFVFTLVGGTLGLYGMVVFSVFLVGYLCNFDSYSTPYLAPIAPNIPEDKKDAFNRINLSDMKTRPKSIPNKNNKRMGKL